MAQSPPQQEQQQERPSIWETGPFCALLADPYVENNSEVPSGGLATACAVLEILVNESSQLERWAQDPVMPKVTILRKLAGAEVDDAEKCNEYVSAFLQTMRDLPGGESLFVPAGWIGSTTRGSIVLVAERNSDQSFNLVVCNAGAGLNYHPCRVCEEDPAKIKYQTCLKLENLSQDRFLDRAVWTTLFSLWFNASEFHRVEVIYDVLLPWITGEPTLAGALERAAQLSEPEWRTAQRAGTSSSWRNLMEAVRYFLVEHRGCSKGEVKELTTTLKVEMLNMALGDMKDERRSPPPPDFRTLIRMGCSTVSHAVLKLGYLNTRKREQVLGLVDAVEAKLKELDDADEEARRVNEEEPDTADELFPVPFDASNIKQADGYFPKIEISSKNVERYAGLAQQPRSSNICDILQVPMRRIQTVEEAVAVLVRCDNVCTELNRRCKDGSSFSSRIALQYQIAELIRPVVTQVLPQPKPTAGDGGVSGAAECIWKNFPSLELEMTCLRLLHKLTMTYAQAWQSFDAPTRAFDSERAVIALNLLAIFDCVVRHDHFDMELSNVLNDDGGYALSTTVCVANLSLYRLSSTMELHQPALALARSKCLEYFESVQQTCRFKDLFIFRMPTDKIEVKKYGTTVMFLRKLMERLGYELVPRDNPQPPPEIEALLEWMTAPGTPLARDHPEYGLLRDMCCMYKFLSTMESRESELQRQRIASSEYVSWGLSFEDTSMEAGAFHTRRTFLGGGLRWEVVNYRGLDLDTADVQVTVFGDRKIFFGEGLVVHSPADIGAILNHTGPQRPTEDDILHADALPNFGDTLSRQESEMVLSYLTVPYLRIPLVLAFFATGDRVTYLFNHEIQGLLRAVLFDASDWVPNGKQDRITTVPASKEYGFRSALQDTGSASRGGRSYGTPKSAVLGTADGLLLNELRHAPESTLRPLMKMLRSMNDLAEASVYSPDAALSLYLIELALDVQSFFLIVKVGEEREREMQDFLTGSCRTILKKWLKEAFENNDIQTSCMIHSYLALVWSNLRPDALDAENVSELMGSLCFVRNWHGFGLGEPSALLGYGSSSESSAPPEQRLTRFLQAHGVDTSRLAPGSLTKYIGQNRPLYLRVGSKTTRVPNLGKDDELDANGQIKKRLLANVPEQKLFSMLQNQRGPLVGFLGRIKATSQEVFDQTLTRIVRIGLDTKGATLGDNAVLMEDETSAGWTVESRGKFLSPDKEMTLDIQAAQILWRNDELKPLPDSMTHFNDFHTIFGKRQLHCGIVAQQQHRNWVHVVGTQYDLKLWDEPKDDDHGVECPKDVTSEMEETAASGGAGGAPTAQSVRSGDRWACPICTFNNGPDASACQMCGAPRSTPAVTDRSGATPNRDPNGGNAGRNGDGGEEEQVNGVKAIRYRGQVYDRHVDPFDEDKIREHLENQDGEKWILELLVSALQAHYKDAMNYRVLLPHDQVGEGVSFATAMACVQTEHEVEQEPPSGPSGGSFASMMMASRRPQVRKIVTSTWKEFIMYKDREVLHVFNLVSHGRRIYRQLVFSSQACFSYHTLQPSTVMFGGCGDLKAIFTLEESLVVDRNRNGFVETFLPSRLLFGVLPSALLEAYQFWHGSDGVVRGEPLDEESTWFGSKQIEIREDRSIMQKPYSTSKRNSLTISRSVLAGTAASEQRRLVVEDANGGDRRTSAAREAQAAAGTNQEDFDQTTVLDLCALGFTPAAARLALSKTDGNSAFAAEWLLNPQNQAQIASADELIAETQRYRVVSHEGVRVRNAPSADSGHGVVSNQTGTLGFGQIVSAVARTGDWVRITLDDAPEKEAWVLAFDPERGIMLEPVSDEEAEAAEKDGEEGDVDAAAERAVEAAQARAEERRKARAAAEAEEEARRQAMEIVDLDEDDPRNQMQLVNLLELPRRNTALFRMVTLLAKVEDISHILAWSEVEDESGAVVMIELPRLKLRVQPVGGKLHLTDQAGWFVCNMAPRYRELLDAHSLLLMNGQRELQFLVPNHTASRPRLKGRPFSTEILCDRGSFSWLQTMDTRYYLYRIHTSCTFLVSQELSASLYLVHLKLLKRQYEQAFKLAPTCTVDVPFSPDEGFIWSQFEDTLDDMHPDAHACRLRLSLATMYARDAIRPSWEVHNEYDRYLSKLPRVSASCRLSHEEELKICRLTASGTALIKNRLAALSVAKLTPIDLKAPAPRVGGAPWNKVQSQSLEYYDAHGTTLKRLHFRPQLGDGSSPSTFSTFMTSVIFDEQIVMDEESGVNRQLGFTFLYQLLTSSVPTQDHANPRAFGEIMARYLHLKLSRWGRESVTDGEVEASNSRHMAQLFAVLEEPSRAWPQVPTDPDSLGLLRTGINLYSRSGRDSGVKMWLDLIDMEFQEAWPIVHSRNEASSRFRPAFVLKDIPNGISHPIQPASVEDTGCAERAVSDADEAKIMREPLAALWEDFIKIVKATSEVPSDSLPFDLHSHPAAQTTVAQDMLKRLEDDVAGFANAYKHKREPVLVSRKSAALDEIVAALEHLQMEDARLVRDTIADVLAEANHLEDPDCKLRLSSHSRQRDCVTFALLTQALLSREASADLQKVNPSLEAGQVETMLDRVVHVLVRTNRISHANRAAQLARDLKRAQSSTSSGADFRADQLARSLAETLTTVRHYVEDDGSFDPRFLVFEYVFDIVLRERQVEIVRSFADDVKHNRSHVQQMIMGAGKTTVVAPLLTLLLADGDTLVTQVMPTALLEQTRHIMRSRFAAIITKRVFTLEFDRGCEDAVDIARAVYDKLDEARRSRSVVVSSPDAVKSLFLKFVEHMHSLESVDPDVLRPTSSLRQNKEIVHLRDTMQARSDMADSMVPIFDMWRDGVLIMDEVDVLLHPLRSELNFPIGLKDPIDMSGFRWDLPIHLLGAFFPEAREILKSFFPEVEMQDHANSILDEIDAVVEAGYDSHALQRNPHLVLLDDAFYRSRLMRPAAEWCALWVQRNAHDLPPTDALVDYMVLEDLWSSAAVDEDFASRSGDNMKLLNLARDWIRVLLPHVLSKIDRVSFGILSPVDLANIDQRRTPLSRKLMAVPFVGKDVPSRSSEFAHPDVVIGLSVLGYRYEGLRLNDMRTIVTQLKADFSREVGPRDQRPSSRLFRAWLEHASRDLGEQLPVLPLPLFQANDPKQLDRLFHLLRKEERVITYYLRQHVFPACMNFQSIKISACGHELGSTLLFQKRIGFSGTPSNLLPDDLGSCMYEPGSDGKIMHVLSSDEVVTVKHKSDWTAKSLLRDVAASQPPIHALIDTGALITGMDNEQVAHYLLDFLPRSQFEGVVYLDRADRKMFLQRSSGKSLHLSQCGVDPSRRFTFYDQVHTTGMDIKQAPDARAVVTIGKDMTFRDYAQGSFRMRGIGVGQKVELYLIAEVEQLIKKDLSLRHSAVKPLDVPAWLLVNSMRMEAIQFSMLSFQELYNCWRKEALSSLVGDVKAHSPLLPDAPDAMTNSQRLRRFVDGADGPGTAVLSAEEREWLVRCIELFREPVGFEVPDHIPAPKPFHEKVKNLVQENKDFATSDAARSLVEDIVERVKYTKDLKSEELEAEIVNENEQEQQQQQEEEAEEEQEKVSRFSRDDEQANPWDVAHLNAKPSGVIGDEPFYRFADFRVRESQPQLDYPDNLLLSDNWFRPRWIGLGDRRLKNVMVVLEWSPSSFTEQLGKLVPLLHQHLMSEFGLAPNAAAVRAIAVATAPASPADLTLRRSVAERLPPSRNPHAGKFFVSVSLAEAETLRRVLHTPQSDITSDYALLSIEDGSCIDTSPTMHLERAEGDHDKELVLACLRFVNCDMHYSDEELELLESAFSASEIQARVDHFESNLRLRRREKYLWGDTPLAKLFTERSEWHLLSARAKLQQLSVSLLRVLRSPKNTIDLLATFTRADADNDGTLTHAELQRMIEDLRLGYSPADVALVVNLIDEENAGTISWDRFVDALHLPDNLLTRDDDRVDLDEERRNQRWQCPVCTCLNLPSDVECQACGSGWDGNLVVPNDKWMCDPEFGGCTMFNDEGSFYCSVCDKARPSLMNVRF
ncbi:Hypothetical Protein FCC1311_030302 [Hondaea fermentalgiana]|uniref:ubiquitinyl hydrolase 1 n=1 Tax=Hondaea fermentalgiana TaxID=2315210 RepID=A0A2R5GAP3_9STRA|nr:Hypothetical Protein FCC1311_030302 [Hondaea fermentalgiana]|eukprot:GBG26808.1 Hypothetical Protein FCC1311_030302 [Hondaea fermentalgiana]